MVFFTDLEAVQRLYSKMPLDLNVLLMLLRNRKLRILDNKVFQILVLFKKINRRLAAYYRA